jgi:hypothetical protein
MIVVLEIFAVVVVAIAMTMALAHTLELPGKLRLTREQYLAVQPIYYPGFTIGGISEPLAILATLALLVVAWGTPVAWLVGIAVVALLVMHLIFWVMTQPVNKAWLQGTELSSAGKRFFDTAGGTGTSSQADWISLRNRWELSHVLRSIVALLALILLVIAVAL